MTEDMREKVSRMRSASALAVFILAIMLAPQAAQTDCGLDAYKNYSCDGDTAAQRASSPPNAALTRPGINYHAELGKIQAQLTGDQKRLEEVTNAPFPSSDVAGNSPACGDVAWFYDFEDGFIPGMENGTASAFRAKVKPALLFENGNHFVRITGSPGDNFSTGGHADRVRSEIPIGASRAAEGTIVTYSFSLRLGDNPPEAAVIMQLFQDGAGPVQGYAVAGDGTGPTVWITYSANEGLKMRNYFNDERDSQEVSLGQIPPDQFVHIDMTVHWSLTNEGWVATWVDGQLAGIMHGAPTNLSPNSHENVSMRVGTYGDGGAGSLDFDNIEIRYGGPNNGVCEP